MIRKQLTNTAQNHIKVRGRVWGISRANVGCSFSEQATYMFGECRELQKSTGERGEFREQIPISFFFLIPKYYFCRSPRASYGEFREPGLWCFSPTLREFSAKSSQFFRKTSRKKMCRQITEGPETYLVWIGTYIVVVMTTLVVIVLLIEIVSNIYTYSSTVSFQNFMFVFAA